MVRTAVSGDMMGEPCWELEAIEEALIAEMGAVVGCCGVCWKLVWTWLGRERRSSVGREDMVGSEEGEGCC